MTLTSPSEWAILTAVVSLGYVLFGGYLLARYDALGVKSLATFSVIWGLNFLVAAFTIYVVAGSGVTSGTQLQSLSFTRRAQLVLISTTVLSGLFTAGGIFSWLWFVLRYTRRIEYREKLAIFALSGFVFLVVALNGFVGALNAFGIIVVQPGFNGFASVIEVLGTGIAVGLGVALLYSTAEQHRPFDKPAVVGLSIPILLPWVVRYLYQFALVPDFRLIGMLRTGSLALGLAGMWLAITRYNLFDQLPASRTVGRQTAFDASDTAIVTVNNNGNISDLNPAAQELFDAPPSTAINSPLDSILPDSVDSETVRGSEPVTFSFSNRDTVLEAASETTTDTDGRAIGQTIVFTDITDERRRQQRIQVLNRVLRHNLRNDINAVEGYIGLIADEDAETEMYRDKAESTLRQLVETGEKARKVENVLAADPLADSPHRLDEILDAAIASVRTDAPGAHREITHDVPPETTVRINSTVLEFVFEEILDNAVRHTDAAEIRVRYEPDRTCLVFADSGPGIPRHEIDVLDKSRETPLEHGSGLGLWLIQWSTDAFGGSVEFDADDSGTRVRIGLPPELVGRAPVDAAAE